MNHLGTMYATKRRRRNSKSVRVPSKEGQTKSNPSKRHRERLNAELDTLASLLPYEQSVLSKLDKLSILRLSVSYLRTKSYFQAALQREKERQSSEHAHKARDLLYPESLMEGDLILQALNGFLMILTCEGEVFYTSHTVETYLGFHQSDICHQSVYELVHSEDREELQRHLMWNSHLPAERSGTSLQEILMPEHSNILERNFTVRFRCLLDNTSGFLRLDIRGRIKILQGQNHKTEEPPLALFAVCTPFGPPSLLEMPQKDSMFKSKHKLDLALVSMDQRGKQLLGYADSELSNKGGYDLVHFDDLAYVASAHQELLKTGASGLIAYRLMTKDSKWQWLQTSARLVYKNSKPDFILCTHRPLIEEEGRDLLGKRTMDFKVTYLDGGLGAMTDRSNSNLMTDSDFVLRCQRNRRYKSQIRDLLSSCRGSGSKRKADPGESTYLEEASAGYSNVYPYTPDNGLTGYAAVSQNLFIDNSRFLAPENFLHYRHHLGGYYSDYHPQYAGNGFLEARFYPPAEPGKEEKLYPCQLDTTKFNGQQTGKASCCEAYDPGLRGCLMSATSSRIQPLLPPPSLDREPTKLNFGLEVLKPKTTTGGGGGGFVMKEPKSEHPSIVFSNDTRQSVLMWGSNLSRSSSPPPPLLSRYGNSPETNGTPTTTTGACKWSVATPKSVSPHNSTSPASGKVAPAVTYGSNYTTEMGSEGWQIDSLGAWRPQLPPLG